MTAALPGSFHFFEQYTGGRLSGPHDKLGLSLLIVSVITVSVNTTVSRTLANSILGQDEILPSSTTPIVA